ncbi:hypothetical protein FE407_07625 [Leuconostoc carnosum]|uniref:Uncharacterized protein n=2 Tax=Leuconostoc carnosum TaxID=1252 RepID=K0DBW1_LEUCJ|nr:MULTISPECIES: hypothetical protein [Leuconostoc]AFT82353.1 hypothetical protein C270_07220 [Leuconostoc carnosum JB16]KAA8324465.1 hypothetical protein FE404_07140 [Leuconostoc carnosum]KAA8327019.1 hypothetical protein FE409_07865 [Leuconostoc carnosum]KAA8358137.1 hypothetical protein FE407_07625 [Leuconostoc carnosum]KAA8364635.1 hypothetical protein FE406_07620 [Leuconostoc carnosum]
MPYFTQQLFNGQRDRILRVVDAASQDQITAGFIHIFDERRAFDFDFALELTEGNITKAEFDEAGEANNTFSINFMPIANENEEIPNEVFEEWAGLISRDYALVPNVHINMYQQALKPEIETIDKEIFEERLLELVTRILGSSVVGFEEKELTLFPSYLVQEQENKPDKQGPSTQIILPD